ncbi:DUF6512 family protein [Aminipila sp.]|uniref:DUF6512 family protein n=1 Tax=Aminipila sp. TaxID=2060095 RepID=UPI0028977589|nr:DUF6512 family protein [Aminipila sp.]
MDTKYWHIAGMLFTLLFGVLLHFTYGWSDGNPLVGIFSAVNESTWEHLKLLFTPIFLFAVLEYFAYGYQLPNFIPVKLLSILLGMFTIVSAFYTYTGIIGRNYFWMDITIFILGVIVAYLFSFIILQTNYFSSSISVLLGLVGICLLLICFIIFTFNPPNLPLFLDPIFLSYGV